MTPQQYEDTAITVAQYIIAAVTENAEDNGDDPSTYVIDEEVVAQYMKHMSSDIIKWTTNLRSAT